MKDRQSQIERTRRRDRALLLSMTCLVLIGAGLLLALLFLAATYLQLVP